LQSCLGVCSDSAQPTCRAGVSVGKLPPRRASART
jgi:hypothetical protein